MWENLITHANWRNNPAIDERLASQTKAECRGDPSKSGHTMSEAQRCLDGLDNSANGDREKHVAKNINGYVKHLSRMAGAKAAQDELTAVNYGLDAMREALSAPPDPAAFFATVQHGSLSEQVARAMSGGIFGSTGPLELRPGMAMDIDNIGAALRATRPEPIGAVFKTTDGYPPDVRRIDRIAHSAQPSLQLFELFGPEVPTIQNAVKYLEETITTEAVAERAEGAAAAEADISLTEKTAAIRSISAYLPVTEEQLADEPTARRYLDQRLMYLARKRLHVQITKGDDSAPNLQGILNASPGTNDIAAAYASSKTTDPLGAVSQAIDKVLAADAEPTGIAINYKMLRAIGNLKDNNERYIFEPATNLSDLWGIPVVPVPDAVLKDDSSAGNKWAVVGSWRDHADLHLRQAARVDAGYIADDFKKVQLSLRVTLRAAITWYRPAAFSAVKRG